MPDEPPEKRTVPFCYPITASLCIVGLLGICYLLKVFGGQIPIK